jgi:hypothetical protein
MTSKGASRRDKARRGTAIARRPDGFEVGIDIGAAGSPDQSFEADAILIRERRGSISFLCEQSREGTRAAVEIRMAIEAFLQLYTMLQAEAFAKPFWEYVERVKGLREIVVSPSEEAPCVPMAALRAQVAVVSNIGTDAEISFFAISVVALANLANPDAKPPAVRGVVRITCHTLVLAEALAAALELGRRLTPRGVPAPEGSRE